MQVIFFIFIKILMLLLSKLKADQVKFTDYRYRYFPCRDSSASESKCQETRLTLRATNKAVSFNSAVGLTFKC